MNTLGEGVTMWEIAKGLMTSLLASQWPLVAVAVLFFAAGFLLRDKLEKIIDMIRKNTKNNDPVSRTDGYRTENGNEDSENKSVAEPNKENGIAEALGWAEKNIERNRGKVFELKKLWVDAIEPVIDICLELMAKIQRSGIICSASIEARGVSKEGKQWFLYLSEDDMRDKGELDKELERRSISNKIIQISVEITLRMIFTDIEEKKTISIKGIFHKPGERVIGEWKDNRLIMHTHDEVEQSSRKGYDRDGIYEMLEEQVKKAIEDWKNANC